jgi:hypothetical protein
VTLKAIAIVAGMADSAVLVALHPDAQGRKTDSRPERHGDSFDERRHAEQQYYGRGGNSLAIADGNLTLDTAALAFGALYSDSSPIPASVVIGRTLHAIAVGDGIAASEVTHESYSMKKAGTPVGEAGGEPAQSRSITLSSPDGGEVWYTTDGSTTPTKGGASQLYSGAIPITVTTRLRTIAVPSAGK